MLVNKDYESLLISLLNISDKDIVSINSFTSVSGFLSITAQLSRCSTCCPNCGSTSFKSLGYYQKKMKLPNELFDNIDVFFKIPRSLCLDCHHSFSDDRPLTPKGSSTSYKLILKVMELLCDPAMTFQSVAKLTGLSKPTVIRIFDKYCHIGHISFPEAICIDEVYTKNSDFDSKYSCIFYDFYNHSIVDVTPSRHKNFLFSYLQKFPKAELDHVKYICIDMYQPYKDVCRFYFKKAIICVDSFHVVKHLNDDLSKLRIRIMNHYDSNSVEYYLLKHWKNLLLDRSINLDNKGKFNKRLNRFINFRQLLDLILQIDPQLSAAYMLKERYIQFNATADITNAERQLVVLINDFSDSNIPEYAEFVVLLKNWKTEIINSFTLYKGRRLNTSVAESMNATIAKLIYNSKGIRNSDRRRKRIIYAVNKKGFSL